jgi:nickel-dependent lactate racemase
MDYNAKLKYGTEDVEIEIKGAASVEVLNPDKMPEIEDVEAAFFAAVTDKAIGSEPLKDKINPSDKVTIVVSDITRSWMHQGDIITLLGHYLHDEMKVPFENITILIALGTHRKSTE